MTVAIATNCNPGSSYTSSMPLCVALAVRAGWNVKTDFARAQSIADIDRAQAGTELAAYPIPAASPRFLAWAARFKKHMHKVEMAIHTRGDHTLSGNAEDTSWPLAIRQAVPIAK